MHRANTHRALRGGRSLLALLVLGASSGGALPPRTAAPAHGTVVVLGDSITYGWTAHGRAAQPWPALLGRRLGPRWRVVNAGVRGNTAVPSAAHCVPCGPAGVRRFDRDVLGVRGVRVVVLALGQNDLLQGNLPGQIAGGLMVMAQRAHHFSLRVVALTITPDSAAPGTARAREVLNGWIRSDACSCFDAVVDADAFLAAPGQPDVLAPPYDSGDGLHPGAAGYRALARLLPLSAITG